MPPSVHSAEFEREQGASSTDSPNKGRIRKGVGSKMSRFVPNKVLTLAFVRDNARILLGLKKRGFGKGRWNGFGGKVEPGENVEDAAKRELKEECGLEANSMDKVGLLMFEFVHDPQLLEVHVFSTNDYTGTVTESDEMRPQWYNMDNVPFKKMWPDDIIWFPLLEKGAKFFGYMTFDGMDTIVDVHLKEISCLDSIQIPKGPQESPGRLFL